MARNTDQLTHSAGQTIVAGAAAGGLESLITYPTEFVKTHQQLLKKSHSKAPNPFQIFINIVRIGGVQELYRGAGAFCVSNASKSAVRFFAFDLARGYLPHTPSGKSTPLGNLLAGLVAGIAESVAVVTPGETIKTRLIDDRNRKGGPQYRGTMQAIGSIVKNHGVSGLYRGIIPVTLKQSSNAVVRFTSYNFLLDQARALSGSEYQRATSMIAGAGAGIITVYCTMPMDNIKTRLQAIGGRERYSGSIDCLVAMVKGEGIASLWKGTTPRLLRLTVAGAISFTIYEQVLLWTQRSPSLVLAKVPSIA